MTAYILTITNNTECPPERSRASKRKGLERTSKHAKDRGIRHKSRAIVDPGANTIRLNLSSFVFRDLRMRDGSGHVLEKASVL